METGDHMDGHKLASSEEVPKDKQHADFVAMETLPKNEQVGSAEVVQTGDSVENFLLQSGGVPANKGVSSRKDINEFILHESGASVPRYEFNASQEQERKESESLNSHIAESSQNIEPEPSGDFPSVSPDIQQDSLERVSKTIDNEQTSTEENVEGNHDIAVNSAASQEDGRGDSVFLDNKVNDAEKTDGQSNENQLIPEISVNAAEEKVSNERKAEEDGSENNTGSNFSESHPKTKEHDEKEQEDDSNKEKGGMESGSKTNITAAGDFIHSERSDIPAGSEKKGVFVEKEHLEFISDETDVKKSLDSDGIIDSKTKDSQVVDTEKVVSGLQKEDSDSHKSVDIVIGESDPKPCEEPTSKDENEEEWLDIVGSGQLMKKILRKAENDYRPQNSFICEINLEGRLEDGTVVEKHENMKIQVGDFEVVQGIDLALTLMNVGEVALLEIGPRFAYGSLGNLPEIPPDAKMTYQIELLSAENEPEMESLSISERRQIGDRKRERGNWWYARKEYSFAIQSYRRALEFLDDAEKGFSVEKKEVSEDTEKQFQELLEDRLKVYNNLAAAHIMNKSYDAALISVENVLRCQPQNVKALRRKAKILAAKGDAAGALSILRNVSQLEPDSTSIKQEMQHLQDVIKHDTKQEKSLYKKMLGQNKTAEKLSPKPPKVSYRTWGIVCSSVAVVLLGAVAYRYKFL